MSVDNEENQSAVRFWLGDEVKLLFPDRSFPIIFDVGANSGRVSLQLARVFPEAQITCFEPAPVAYSRLTDALSSVAGRATLVNAALGGREGKVMFTTVHGMGNRVIEVSEDIPKSAVCVEVMAGDSYCERNGVLQIDLLKIDTEGFDLDCLVGFSQMLRERRIFLIEVEATTNLDNRFHVHLERFIHWLHPFGYRIASIGDFERRIYKTNQSMRGAWFCNALFVLEHEDAKLRRDGRN
jgi:FkbM family methyltransferase